MNPQFIRLNPFVPSEPPQTGLYITSTGMGARSGPSPVWWEGGLGRPRSDGSGADPGPALCDGPVGLSIIIISSGSLRCTNTRSKESLSIFSPHSCSTELLSNWSCDNPPIDLLHRVESAPRLLGGGLKMPRNVCLSLELRVPEFINP